MSPVSHFLPGELDVVDKFESVLCDISTRFINLPASQIDLAIENAQRLLCRGLGLDRSTLWEPHPDKPGSLYLTHACQPAEIPPITDAPDPRFLHQNQWILQSPGTPLLYRNMESKAFLPWLAKRLELGQMVIIENLDDLPPEAAQDAEILRRYCVLSTVGVPLHMGEEQLGCLTFASTRTHKTWRTEDVKRFEMIGHVFSHALARRNFEQSLRESEERFRTIADSAPVLIWMSDIDNNCFFFNKGWLAFTGRSLEQECGKGWMDGVHPKDRRDCEEINTKAFASRQSFLAHWRLRRNDGVYRWVVSTGVPRFDAEHRFCGYIGSCVDLSERIEAEAAARDLSGRLINAQEIERARVARELHDDVVQRLARLAIDVGRIERMGVRDNAADDLLRGVRSDLVQLSNDIHALSYELHPSTVIDLGLVDALKAECQQLSKRGAIAAEVTVRTLPAAIPSDMAICLFRIAQEALRNAVKHGRASRGQITLRGVDGGVQLAVRDDGVGFHIKQHRTTHSLGLASMRERARLLGGTLDVESNPGEGTMVVAWIPLLTECSP